MNISVILAHPNKKSLNHSIAQIVVNTIKKKGHEVFFHDLYEESFFPVIDSKEIPSDACLDEGIEKYCTELMDSDGIIVIHPNWWGQPPAILKGWVDRIIRPGVAYRFLEGDNGEGIPDGLLKAKFALVFNTSNTPYNREKEIFGDPLENLWKTCIFSFCGVNNFSRENFGVVVTSTEKQREKWLERVKEVVLEKISEF